MSDENNVLAPYAAVAQEVVNQLGARAGTDGDPQLYGHVYAGLVGAYLGGVLAVRPLGPADGFVLDVFRAIALSVSGGVQPQRFRDVITAALSASVHVEDAMAALRAQNAAKAPGNAAATMAEHLANMDRVRDPVWKDEEDARASVLSDGGDLEAQWRDQEDCITAEDTAFLDSLPDEVTVHPDPGVAVNVPGVLPEGHPYKAPRASVEFEVHPAPDATLDEDDEARASDEDLLRWTLTPGSDPWGDLLEDAEPGQSAKREMRVGVTQAMVQARFERLHGLLDTSKAPEGVKPEVWEAAKARALPITFGDRGPA